MNLNTKVLLHFIFTVLIIVIFLSLIIENNIDKSLKLEENFLRKDIKKLNHIFYTNSNYLKKIAFEYSQNTQLLNSIKNKNISLMEEHFSKSYMQELQLSHFAIFDSNKNYLYGDSNDLSSNELFDTPSELISFIKKNDLSKYTKNSDNTYFMTLNYEKAIFFVKEIMNNNKIIGYIYFARTIDSDFLSQLSEVLQNYISLIPNYQIELFQTMDINKEQIIYEIQTIDEVTSFSYIHLFDELENNTFYIRMKNDRDLYREIISGTSDILWGVGICFLLLIIIFNIFLKNIFTNRINYITKMVKQVVSKPDLNLKIKTSYADEITYLASKLNEMFISINEQQNNERKQERDFLQSILDTQSNIVVITHENTIHNVNKRFIDVFKSKENFLNNISLIDDLAQENFLNIAKEYSINEKAAKFKLTDTDKYFTFNVSQIDLKRHLISINDVSSYNKKILNLENKVSIDPLTKIYNKESMTNIIKEKLKDEVFHLSIIDIDFFKKINDTYGHLIGDYILRDMAKLIKNIISKEDFFGRVGGEEFMLITNENKKENILSMSNRIRQNIQSYDFLYDKKKINITLSIGCTINKQNDTYEALFKRADSGLYEAKKSGRNKVIYV